MTEQHKQIITALCKYNMCQSEVARRMNYHRNTLIYHIQKIKDQTGLDPLKFYDLVKLRTMVGIEDEYLNRLRAMSQIERERLILGIWGINKIQE